MAKRVLKVTVLVEVDDSELDDMEIEGLARDLPASIQNRLFDDERVTVGDVYRTYAGAHWDSDGYEYAETKAKSWDL